jgi:hypothetical protein
VPRIDDITELARLAQATDGCLTVGQIRAVGYSKREIATLTRRGILRRVFIGVYVLATTALTHAQAIRAALLAAGPGAHVAGRTALELRGVAKPHRAGDIWIAVVGGQRRPRRTTRVPLATTGRRALIHVVRAAGPVETEQVQGIPVATVARALVDVGKRESASMLRRLVREADYRRLLVESQLAGELDRNRHGARVLRSVLPKGPLARAFSGSADSRAAHRLLRALIARGAAPDSINEPLRVDELDCRPDFLYTDPRLAVEADGPQHDLPERQAEDAARDATLAAHGIDTLRVRTSAIRRDVDACADLVVNRLEDLRHAAATGATVLTPTPTTPTPTATATTTTTPTEAGANRGDAPP